MLGAIPGLWAVAFAGLVLLVAPRAVFFPVVVYRPEMLCIMAGMDHKDSIALFSGSCMYKVGFTGDSAPHAVFFPSCRQAQMLGIPASMDQKDITEVACFTGSAGGCSSRCVHFVVGRPAAR